MKKRQVKKETKKIMLKARIGIAISENKKKLQFPKIYIDGKELKGCIGFDLQISRRVKPTATLLLK